MENESLTGIIISVSIGILSILFLLFRSGTKRKGIFRQLYFIVLTGNLIWYSALSLEYFNSVKPGGLDPEVIYLPDLIFSTLIFVLRFMFLFFFFGMALRLVDLSPGRQVKRILKICAFLIILSWFSGWSEIPLNGSRGVTDRMMVYMDILVFAGVTLGSIYIYFRAPHVINGSNRPAIRKLSYVFLIPVLLGLLKWIIGDSLHMISASFERYTIYALVVLFNFLIIWWTIRFGNTLTGTIGFIKHFHEEIRSALPEKYGLTDREMDVVKLICEGKSNKEIADILFLSVDTIKDHNHDIFIKTGVKNRTQLANLFSGGQFLKSE